MKSTYHLFNACKTQVLWGCLCAFLLSAYVLGMWYLDRIPPSFNTSSMQSLTFFWTILAAALAAPCHIVSGVHGALLRLPVPVTPRHSAHIPLLVSFIHWGITQGVFCICLLHDSPKIDLTATSGIGPAMLDALPFGVALLAFNNWMIGSLFPFSFLAPLLIVLPAFFIWNSTEAIGFAKAMGIEYLLPLQLGALVFSAIVILDTPSRRRSYDRGLHTPHPKLMPSCMERDPISPIRLSPGRLARDLAVSVTAVLAFGAYSAWLAAAWCYVRDIYPEWNLTTLLALGAFLLTLPIVSAKLWLSHVARIQNGEIRPQARFSQIAMQFSRVQFRFVHEKILKPPILTKRCTICNKLIPLWQERCECQEGERPDGKTGLSTSRTLWTPIAGYYLVMLMLLLGLCGFTVLPRPYTASVEDRVVDEAVERRWVTPTLAESALEISLPPGIDPDSAMAQLHQLLNHKPDPEDWMPAAPISGEQPAPTLPRFRIEVKPVGGRALSFNIAGLRWERPEWIAYALAAELAETIGANPPEVRTPRTLSWGRLTARYLDNTVYEIKSDGSNPVLRTGRRPVYVNVKNRGSQGNGDDWSTAFDSIQDGLDAARRSGACEVWVAQGKYDERRYQYGELTLWDGIRLYGGFAGHETRRDERNPEQNPTVIDGSTSDRGKPAGTVIRADGDFVLDGFTVVGGKARSSSFGLDKRRNRVPYGGGLTIEGGVSLVADCSFDGNTGSDEGGALYVDRGNLHIKSTVFQGNSANSGGALESSGSTLLIEDCTFTGNHAVRGGALYLTGSALRASGLVFNHTGEPDIPTVGTLVDCTFVGNSAKGGGAVVLESSALSVLNSVFRQNTAEYGGVISIAYDYVELFVRGPDGRPTDKLNSDWEEKLKDVNCDFTNCLLIENTAEQSAGAIASGLFTLKNCTLAGNRAGDNVLFFQGTTDRPRIANSILWDNGDDTIPDGVTIDNSIVQGGYPGDGNLDADPRFIDTMNGDYRLRPDSPAIDAGNSEGAPEDDLNGAPRPQGNGVDMGAYEHLPQANSATTGQE